MTKRPLYNEEQKLAFMKEAGEGHGNVYNRMMSIFRAAAPFEEKWGADLSTVPQVDLEEMIDKTCGVRLTSKYTNVTILRDYMRWCAANGFAGAHELGDVNYGNANSLVRESYVRNPEHLQQCMNKVFDRESDCTQDNIYRAFMWLAYGGMSEETAYSLETSDISFENMEAVKNDEIAIIYRQGIQAIRNCVRLTEFTYRNAGYINAGEIQRSRVPGTRILRGIRADQNMINFRSQLSRRLRKAREGGQSVDMLSYRKVWLSGVFYRVYEAEQAGIAPDFLDIAIDAKHLKSSTLTAHALRNDYIRWKTVGASA